MLVYQRVIGLMDYITVHCGSFQLFWAPALACCFPPGGSYILRSRWGQRGSQCGCRGWCSRPWDSWELQWGEMPGKINQWAWGVCIKASYHIIIGMWCADITNTLQQDGCVWLGLYKKCWETHRKIRKITKSSCTGGSGVGSLNPCQMEARISLKMWDGPSVV